MKTKHQQCSLSRFKTISTTHLAQGPLKTHNIKHRYCIYTTKTKERKQKQTLTTVAQYAVQVLCQLVAVTQLTCSVSEIAKRFILDDTGIYTVGLLDQYSELVIYSKTCGAISSLWPWNCVAFGFTQRYRLPTSLESSALSLKSRSKCGCKSVRDGCTGPCNITDLKKKRKRKKK